MRNKQLQKRANNYGLRKATSVLEKVGSQLLDQLSIKCAPNIRYKTDRPDLDGRGIPIPFPFVDFKKLWNVVSDPKLFKGPEVSEKEGRAMVAETGEILEFFQKPTGPSDAVAMQHDVEYSSCGFRAKKYGEDEKNASMLLTEKWSNHLTLFHENKDSGATRWRETRLI